MEGVAPALARAFVGVVLLAHAAVAAVWVWAMPHGFPWLHRRTFANELAPLVALGLALLAGHARRDRPARTAAVAAGLAGAWLGALAGLVVTFPVSGPRAAPLAAAGLAVTALAAALARRAASPSRRALFAAALLGVAFGAALPWTQRGPDPDTRPLLPPGAAFPPPSEGWPAQPAPVASDAPSSASSEVGPSGARTVRAERSSDRAATAERSEAQGWPESGLFADAHGRLELDLAGGARLRLEPLLAATSRSPDRGWTLLSTPAERAGPVRALVAARDTPGLLVDATFASADGPAGLRARARGAGPRTFGREAAALEVEAFVTLERPVFAHLCTFARIVVEGVDAPRVAFGALPACEIVESDYPVGRPARLACFTGSHLRLLEATSGEKGPFTELGATPLARGDPLVVTLLDGERPLVRLTFLDFTAQAGLALSPTAGWGLPVNAIELQRHRRTAWLFLTLAATSVGRGFDSVGHAPGVYRDRIVVERLR